MEAAASVVTVFGDADVVAADGAFAKVAFVVPLPEVHWVFLSNDACVEGCVNVDFDFAVEFALDVVDFVERCLHTVLVLGLNQPCVRLLCQLGQGCGRRACGLCILLQALLDEPSD